MTDSILAAGPLGALHVVVVPSAAGQLLTLATYLSGVCFLVGFTIWLWAMLDGVVLFQEIAEARRVAAVQTGSGETDPILTLDLDEPGGLLHGSNRELLRLHPDLMNRTDRVLRRFGLAAWIVAMSVVGFLGIFVVVSLLESTG